MLRMNYFDFSGFITARKWSCREVMFSQVSVCSQAVGYLWSHVISRGWVSLISGPSGYVQGVGISRGWVCPGNGYIQGVNTHPQTWNLGYHRIQLASRQYASYWDAFLLDLFILNTLSKVQKLLRNVTSQRICFKVLTLKSMRNFVSWVFSFGSLVK